MLYNDKPEITVVDQADYKLCAEGIAKLSALCSRSTESPNVNLQKVINSDPGEFMERVYLNYGHASVGKMGTTNLFINGVSMLLTKEFQSGPLYVGQESSTRYITFSDEGVYLPKSLRNDLCARDLISEAFDLYNEGLDAVYDHLVANIACPDGVDDKAWEGTLRARTFDICRSLLPAACRTVLVWNTHLENAKRELFELMHDDMPEVKAVARSVMDALIGRYPSSFRYPTIEESEWMESVSEIKETVRPLPERQHVEGIAQLNFSKFDGKLLNKTSYLLAQRPRYGQLPDVLGHCGRIEVGFEIDFGGHRDLQRHRKGNYNASLLTPALGFHSWYLDSMPAVFRNKVERYNTNLRNCWAELLSAGVSIDDLQYIVTMGFKVNVKASYPVDNAVYVAELRSGPTVHPTVREVAQNMAAQLESALVVIPMYYSTTDVDAIDVRRAGQTIVNNN